MRDYSICSKLNSDYNTLNTPGTTSCHRPQNNTCSHVALGNTIIGPNRNWNINGSYSCISSNVIYSIARACCEKHYISDTKRRLADRFTEHLRSIKNYSPGLPVTAHFYSSVESIFSANVSIITTCADTYRKTEECPIYKLAALEPRGMNDRFLSFPPH